MTATTRTDDLARRAAARRTFNGALAVPCHRHHVLIGAPCWSWPAARPGGECMGVCAHRLATAKADQQATTEGRALPRSRRRSRTRAGRRP